jgi:hypothetical protein
VIVVCGEDASAASSADTDAKCGGVGGEGEDVEMLVSAWKGTPAADELSPRGLVAQRCA